MCRKPGTSGFVQKKCDECVESQESEPNANLVRLSESEAPLAAATAADGLAPVKASVIRRERMLNRLRARRNERK